MRVSVQWILCGGLLGGRITGNQDPIPGPHNMVCFVLFCFISVKGIEMSGLGIRMVLTY